MGQDKQRSSKGQAAADRTQRLASALRENLKKRKQQTRARKAKDAGSGPGSGEDTGSGEN